jgi:hypothetical protein
MNEFKYEYEVPPAELRAEEAPTDPNDAKKEINNVIWMYGPAKLTLAEAEDRACKILAMILAEPSH